MKIEESGKSCVSLLYFGARYYNSDISVWLSVDPMTHKHPDYTPYAYCYNNPINFIDPCGLDSVPVANGKMWYVSEGYLIFVLMH